MLSAIYIPFERKEWVRLKRVRGCQNGRWKFNELKDICHTVPKQIADGKWRFRTFQHPFFSSLRKEWYPDDVKIVSEVGLQHISELGLAVWYMDDGHLGKVSNFLKISTCSFSQQDHQILTDWLRSKFQIRSHMAIYSGYRNLVIDLESRKPFIELVKDNLVPCLQYKAKFREYAQWVN